MEFPPGHLPTDRVWPYEQFGRPHHCMNDPEAGFPRGMPDVGRDGTTWDDDHNVIGPWFHACATCGERYHWHEVCGFVGWYLPDDTDRDAAEARIAGASPSAAERERSS